MILLPMKRSFALRSVPFFFLSLVLSVSIPATDLSQHCANEILLLSASLACSLAGAGDLVFPIGQHLQPIYVDSYVENSGNSDFAPWSYKPFCTELLEDIGSKLCVYTNITFSGGRGISIFTTPRIAEEFAVLLPFQDSTALEGINSSEGPWYTKKLPGKGMGVLAKGNLERGDLVTAYTPLLLVYRGDALSTRNREKFLWKAVDQLPFASRESYLSLATTFDDPALVVQDIINTNAYDLQVGGRVHLAIFPEPSRINHDCAPNSQYYLEPSLLTYFVRATRSISRDEEITVSYLKPLHPHESRQEYLLEAFHFTCSCSRCMSKDASDALLAEITSLQQVLGDWSPGSTATTKKAEKLIQLYKELGLDSFLNIAYGHAALTYNAVGDSRKSRNYATLAAEAVALKDGERAADFKMWNAMVANPKEHWSWRRRRH